METVVYFSTKFIRIIQGEYRNGRFNIGYSSSPPAPADSVLNGVILDSGALLETFGVLKQQFNFGKTTVVVDSNRVVHKVAVLPRCSKKQMEFVVKNEFIDKNIKSETHVYDYSVITPNFGGKNKDLVLCCALERSIVSAYSDFFKSAGINLARIDVSVSSIINLSKIFKTAQKNKIICVADHNVVNLLDINPNGTAVSNRSRIIADESGDNYYAEVLEKIHSYIQFRKSADRAAVNDSIFLIDSNSADPGGYNEASKQFDFHGILTVGLKNALENGDALKDGMDKFVYNLGMIM